MIPRKTPIVSFPITSVILGLCLVTAFPQAAAGATSQGSVDPGEACINAARSISKKVGMPAGLLHAIGLVESGWLDPAWFRRTPWPYAVDVDGAGYWFGNATVAARFVQSALGNGARFVDVGCFQIDLEYHPNAFTSLLQAFNPKSNAAYAAKFLLQLHAQLGSWPAAIAAYHSDDPSHGERYAQRVIAVWDHTPRRGESAPSRTDPYVIHIGPPQLGLPHIITP